MYDSLRNSPAPESVGLEDDGSLLGFRLPGGNDLFVVVVAATFGNRTSHCFFYVDIKI